MSGDVDLNDDHQGVSPQVLCGVYHHRPPIRWVVRLLCFIIRLQHSIPGNKECPTCRKKLVSRRSLRPDPNFDALLAKIFPDREEYEEQQEKVWSLEPTLHIDSFRTNGMFLFLGSGYTQPKPQRTVDVQYW